MNNPSWLEEIKKRVSRFEKADLTDDNIDHLKWSLKQEGFPKRHCDLFSHSVADIPQLIQVVEKLRGFIDFAPHSGLCSLLFDPESVDLANPAVVEPCDCWKSRALAYNPQEETNHAG